MLADSNRYRGFLINVEMHEGKFMPTYHDPIHHKKDSWCRMPKCLAETQEGAITLAHQQIDAMTAHEATSVLARMEKSWAAGKK